MGLGFSKDTKKNINYLGGNENFLNNKHDLKKVENKLVEFLNSTGFISSGVQDFPNYIKQITTETDSSNKDFNPSGNIAAINGIKDYMSDGLNIQNVHEYDDNKILEMGYGILNNINKSTLNFMDEDKAMLNYNINEISNMHNNLSNSINNLKQNNSLNTNVLNLLNKTTNLLEQQSKYMNLIKNSDELSTLYDAMNNNLNADNTSLGKNILNYMNNVAKTANNLHEYRELRKLYDDDKINLNTNVIKQMKSYVNDLNENMSFDSVSQYVRKLYETIDNNKNNIHGGGSNNSQQLFKNRLLLNKNWDSSETVNNIFLNNNTNNTYTGSSELKPLKFNVNNENNYEGGVTLQNKLRNTLSVSNAARNNEIIKNANILSEKLNSVSGELLNIIPDLRRLDIIQLNDFEKIFKKFLYFTSFKYKNMFLILLDFYIDMQSSFIKQDFMLKINNLINLMEKGSSISNKLNNVGAKLTDIINFINKASNEYNTKYGLVKENRNDINTSSYIGQESPDNTTSNLKKIDAYDSKINIDYDDIPDLNIINTVISQSVFRLLYSIRLQIYYKQLSETSNNHDKNYEELVGKSIGAEIDKIKEDYTKIMNKIQEFEHNGQAAEFKDDKSIELNYPVTVIPIPLNLNNNDVKYDYVEIKKIFMYLPTTPPEHERESNVRDHRAWGRNDVSWVDDETLRGVHIQNEPITGENLRNMINNYKEFFINYYESVIGLYMVAQAIDIYLMQFTEKIKKTPEIIEKLDSLLSSSKIASMLHSDKSLDKLIDVFDPNKINNVEKAYDSHENITKWCNLQNYKTMIAFNNYNADTSDNNPNPLLFHHYFGNLEESEVSSEKEKKLYHHYTNINNDEISQVDKFYKKSSILACGAGACNDLHPMIDLIMNRIPDNSLNRGGLYNRHWSKIPGSFDALGKLIYKYSNVNDINKTTVNNVNNKDDEKIFHCMGNEYFEKYKFDGSAENKKPTQKMKELKEFHKHNTTLLNILSLFFSMIGIDENSTTLLSPKTIQEYLTNFMCWGSYTLTNVPSTLDVNIGNCIPLLNSNNEITNNNIESINYSNSNIGKCIYSYFVTICDLQINFEQQYNNLFDYSNPNITGEFLDNTVYDTPKYVDGKDANMDSIKKPNNMSNDDHYKNEDMKRPPFVLNNKGEVYAGKYINNITLNKLIKTLGLMKRNIPNGMMVRLNNKYMYNRLEENMFKVSDVTRNYNVLANTNNPLFVGINDNLSVFNKNYTAMNIFDTNVRVTLIHSNQLLEVAGSKYVNTLQYKSQNLYSNIIKSIIGKILTVIGMYDLNDYKNNKPWRTYIMDTTRLTLGGSNDIVSQNNIIRNDLVEYYIRIPLLLKFYKTIFYDISQDDQSLKHKVTNNTTESVKILPEFEYPFDALIKHYFMFSKEGNNNNDIINTGFNKNLYININKVYDHFSKQNQNKSNLLTFISQQLVKEINQKYGLLFNSDLTMYKTRIAKYFGMDNDYIDSLFNDSSSLLYDDDNILINATDKQSNLPSQKYTKVKDAYKNDAITSFTNFSPKSYYDNIFDFRKFIQSILTDSINDKHFSEKYNLYSSFFDIEEYMNDIKNELKNNNNMTDEDKILFLSSATHSQKTSINNTEANKKQLLFDFVITPLKQLDNLMNFLSHLRALFSNEIINNDDVKHSINSPKHWNKNIQDKSLFVLPSNSQLLYNLSNDIQMTIDNDINISYAMSALYGYTPDIINKEGYKNLMLSYVPFNEILTPHPLNHEYNYKYAYTSHETIFKNNESFDIKGPSTKESVQLPVTYNDPNMTDIQQDQRYNKYMIPRQKPNDNSKNPQLLSYIENVTYNKFSGDNNAFFISNVLYIDSQYHNELDLYDDSKIKFINNLNVPEPRYGLLGDLVQYNINVFNDTNLFIYDENNPGERTGRRIADGILLGEKGAFYNNKLQTFPLDWRNIKTTNMRLICNWCPEDLSPNRLGLHEYPHIKQGQLQNRAYNSTYSTAEYLISKLFKNCDLFDINSTPNVQSSFNVLGNVSISFNKIDGLIKEQLLNVTKVLNEFKTYVISEYIHPCEFYLRTINSQYNSLFTMGIKHNNNILQKTTIYDIQGRLNRFLSGSLTKDDITFNAKNESIANQLQNENNLLLDPCETTNDNENGNFILQPYDNTNILTSLNKMGARLITKLINPLIFNNNESKEYVYNPARLAYLPHQKLTTPLNTQDDQFYGKLSMEFFSDIQGASPQQNVHMIKTSDILYSEPNPKYCNFYFTNIVNSVNYIIGTLLKAGSNTQDKKIYNKIVNIFKNHNEMLSSTIDTRFESIREINYLGDYGRTGHGTFFDKSLPFILYNQYNVDIENFINDKINNNGNNILQYITNYKNDSLYDANSFHHLTLSSIDGLTPIKYMSSFICKPNKLDLNNLNYNQSASANDNEYSKYKVFKDTHEGMMPSIEPRGIELNSYFGHLNIKKTKDKFYWYDIIGKPGIDQPLVNICEILPFRKDNIKLNDIISIPKFNNEQINKLTKARNAFSMLYSYGAIQQSNFIYNDINKFQYKPVILETYRTNAAKYTPTIKFDESNADTHPFQLNEMAAKWLKSINDPLKFFSKLQPFNINVPENSYILGIVSETLHGQYAPHIITNVYNGPVSNIFNKDTTKGIGKGKSESLYSDVIKTNPEEITYISDNNKKISLYELNLIHMQYTKDHLRLGQAIAAYNPLTLGWDSYQPLQYDIKKDKNYKDLEKIQIKNKDNIYVNMFQKLSYARLLSDLSAIDSKHKLDKLQSFNNVLYSLSLASSYSTPRNEYYGSALYEYRPTNLSDPHIEKKLYASNFTNNEMFTINTSEARYEPITPYDSVLSLEIGGTGYWQPTGMHPVITEGLQLLYHTATAAGDPNNITFDTYNGQVMNITGNIAGLNNAVLQPSQAHTNRFGALYNAPDAYVPLEKYLRGTSVLNYPERGIKEMTKDIHNTIFKNNIDSMIEIDKINYKHLKSETVKNRISTNTITKAAMIALATCDSRMGPYNMLSAIDDNSGVLPKTNILKTPEKLIKGGGEFTSNNASTQAINNNISNNILAIALQNSDEPLAINFLDNNKSIANGNIMIKTYATVIKNMLTNWVGVSQESKRNLYENLSDVNSGTKSNLAAAIPYLLNEINIINSQLKLLQYFTTNNKALGNNKSVLELNLKQAKTIVNLIQQGLESMKNEFNEKYLFGEQYSGHLQEISTNPSQNITNISFSAELYNYLSNCNEHIIRPLGSHNIYYKLNDITKNSHSSFFKRLYAVRKLYEKNNRITCDECPSITKSLNKLNILLDKYTRKLDKSLIENVINSCKNLKFNPFEESNINQFVCLANNTYSTAVYNMMKRRDTNNNEDDYYTIKASVTGFSKYFNVHNEDLNDLNIDDLEPINKLFKSHYLTPLNSLLFIANDNQTNYINTVNNLLGDDSLANNDIEFYKKYDECFDNFIQIIDTHGKNTKYESNVMKISEYKNSIYNEDHYQLMVFNILDLNILPIDINALTREIPLFYIFNYSSSLDEFLSSSLEAYNTEIYTNDVISKKTKRYVDQLIEYLSNITPSAKEYFITFNTPNLNNVKVDLDLNKILYHNKFSHMNPQSPLINNIWSDKIYNNSIDLDSQSIGYNQIEFLTKFNTITNLVSNIFTATSAHKLNSVNNLMDVTQSYKYDYHHYSSSLYYNGVDLDISKSVVDYYKNVTYNTSNMINSYQHNFNIDNIMQYMDYSKNFNIFDTYKTIMDFTNINYQYDGFKFIDVVESIVNNKLKYNESMFLGAFIDYNHFDMILGINPKPNYEHMLQHSAATNIYGSRYKILGYYDNDFIYNVNTSGSIEFLRQNYIKDIYDINSYNNKPKPYNLHNIYLNSFVKHNNYNCMFNMNTPNNNNSILYTNTLPKPTDLLNSNISNSVNANTGNYYVYEISLPGFETNLCNNWLKLDSETINKYHPNTIQKRQLTKNAFSIMVKSDNDFDIMHYIYNNKTNDKLSPNPCYFNNMLFNNNNDSNKYELFRELPYSTFYNLSCLLSPVNDTYINSITSLHKLENARFMKSKLDELASDDDGRLNKFINTIKLKSFSSWGIIDPRTLGFLGTQETLYKTVSICLTNFDTDLIEKILYSRQYQEYLNAKSDGDVEAYVENLYYKYLKREGFGIPSEDDRSIATPSSSSRPRPSVSEDTAVDDYTGSVDIININTVFNRHPINSDDINNINNKNILPKNIDQNIKGLRDYIMPLTNNISSDWMECNKSAKLHTSNKWLRLKPKTLFNHVLPISDTKTKEIYKMVNEGMFDYKSLSNGYDLINSPHNIGLFDKLGAGLTEGVHASDLHANNYTDNNKMRKIHVLSNIMYNEKTFGYVPLRQLMLLDLGYNFIRYKITQENLYTTNKIISGTLLYDSEYHNSRVYEDVYGKSGLTKKTSIIPRVKAIKDNVRN